MPDFFRDVEHLLIGPTHPIPLVRGWNRLEGRPRATDFSRALRSEVRDALWMLTRQWQFGEFAGDDAGSPVEGRVVMRTLPLETFAARGGPSGPYDPSVPLEARVECEPIPADLVTHLQVSERFFDLIAGEPQAATLRTLYRTAYPLTASALEGYLDQEGALLLGTASAQALDGATLLRDVASGAHDDQVAGFPGLADDERARLREAGARLLEWWRRLYLTPPGASDTWAPAQLEYQFQCVAGASTAEPAALDAEQYAAGRLDWYAFDVGVVPPPPPPEGEEPPEDETTSPEGAAPPEGEAPPPPEGEVKPAPETVLSFIPAPVSFAGMPAHRYWEMEDRKTDFAAIDAGTTDVAKLLLTEFALLYSNDWCVLPHEVGVGALCEVRGLVVLDDFGERVWIQPAGRGADDQWQRWSLFTLSTAAAAADLRLFLPPAVTRTLEAAPLEKVLFLRDEMANMAWAVERTVPTARGEGMDGYTVVRETTVRPPPLPRRPTAASVDYVLGTDVPANWHPFIPVHRPQQRRSIQLQRARLPVGSRPIRGAIVAPPSPYYLNEEEVSRAGKIVTRAFQRARWLDGVTVLWLGRRVQTGRGEGVSGLAFDQIVERKPPA